MGYKRLEEKIEQEDEGERHDDDAEEEEEEEEEGEEEGGEEEGEEKELRVRKALAEMEVALRLEMERKIEHMNEKLFALLELNIRNQQHNPHASHTSQASVTASHTEPSLYQQSQPREQSQEQSQEQGGLDHTPTDDRGAASRTAVPSPGSAVTVVPTAHPPEPTGGSGGSGGSAGILDHLQAVNKQLQEQYLDLLRRVGEEQQLRQNHLNTLADSVTESGAAGVKQKKNASGDKERGVGNSGTWDKELAYRLVHLEAQLQAKVCIERIVLMPSPLSIHSIFLAS